MASHSYPLEVEVTISSAKDLKNVNWKHGDLKPYAVVWIDPKSKSSTKVDDAGDTSPSWNQTLLIPLTAPIDDSTLYIDIVHANAGDDTKPLIGSARLPLKEIVDDVGIGEKCYRNLKLKRPSGRPQGKLELEITVREPRYRAPDPYYAPPYGVPPPSHASREYAPPYGYQYAPPQPPSGYPYNPYPNPSPYGQAPPAGYSYNQNPPAYGQPSYGQQGYYGQEGYGGEEKKKSKFGGMGTGLAVGAAAGLLGGLAIAEGVDYVEDKIADDAADKVEDDLGYDDDGFGGDDF